MTELEEWTVIKNADEELRGVLYAGVVNANKIIKKLMNLMHAVYGLKAHQINNYPNGELSPEDIEFYERLLPKLKEMLLSLQTCRAVEADLRAKGYTDINLTLGTAIGIYEREVFPTIPSYLDKIRIFTSKN